MQRSHCDEWREWNGPEGRDAEYRESVCGNALAGSRGLGNHDYLILIGVAGNAIERGQRVAHAVDFW